MGDLNAGWNKEEIVSIEKLLKNTTVGGNMFTFDTINPRWQIDYIFTSDEFETENVRVPEILFSDHSPIVAGLKF
jgi:endonuclease/exonuclease/phosphatase (EEP) superfamily protein YafD